MMEKHDSNNRHHKRSKKKLAFKPRPRYTNLFSKILDDFNKIEIVDFAAAVAWANALLNSQETSEYREPRVLTISYSEPKEIVDGMLGWHVIDVVVGSDSKDDKTRISASPIESSSNTYVLENGVIYVSTSSLITATARTRKLLEHLAEVEAIQNSKQSQG